MKKILLIRFSSIGDVVLTTPIVRCIKSSMDVELHFLIKKKFASILDQNPYIDKIIHLEETNLRQLKSENYDIVYDMQKSMKSRWLGLNLAGRYFTYKKLNFEKWLYVQFKKNILPQKHLVDRYFEAIAQLGVPNDGLGLDYFYTTEKKMIEGPYDVIVLGAAHATKRIVTSLALKLIQHSRKKVVLLGGSDVLAQAQELAKEDRVINLCNKTTIPQSAALMRYADKIYTGDTGMMHIAAALKKQVVVFWGNTLPAFGMYPYYGDHQIAYESHEVLNLSCRPCSKLGFGVCPKGHHKCMVGQKV